ncbi:hypothetical protein RRG08_033239 [Elysia crispata]|uniref:Uncharacterized protein n=1 Tax=Elysia crispata TaxID=231223 RepID=A0AAE1A8K4_9GAST|nr:hypothetical protein RRG08_033239 [Elysia crispata]
MIRRGNQHQHIGSVILQTLSDSDSDSSVTNPFHSDNDETYIPDSCDDDDDNRDEASFLSFKELPQLCWRMKFLKRYQSKIQTSLYLYPLCRL